MPPPVIILSLDDATMRRAPLINTLKAHGVAFEIWSAIDGRGGLASDYEAMVDRPAARAFMNRDLGNAEFACALSHYSIYREILDRGLDMAVILEDDAIIDHRFVRFLNSVTVPRCDLILLDHMRALVSRVDRLRPTTELKAYRCKSNPWLTTGYLITRSGAQKMVDQSLPISAPADWPIDITQMQSYALYPRLVDHPDMYSGASDIRQDRPAASQCEQPRKPREPKRFLRASYWRKTYYKRLGKWVS